MQYTNSTQLNPTLLNYMKPFELCNKLNFWLFHFVGSPTDSTQPQLNMLSIPHTDSTLNLTAGFKGYPAPTVSVSGATFPLKSLTPQVHTLSDCSQEVGVSVVWGTEDEGERRAANGRQVTWSAGDHINVSVTLEVLCKYTKPC